MRRRTQPVHARPMHHEMPGPEPLVLDAHRRQRGERRGAVLALQETLNFGPALRDCAEQRRSVRDRLVTGYSHFARDPAARIRDVVSG